MDLTTLPDSQILSYLASQIRAERLRRGYSQASMSKYTGIPLRTYKRIELAESGSIQNLIVILRALERTNTIKLLFPSPEKTTRTSLAERIHKLATKSKP